jgi:hypothetical protein
VQAELVPMLSKQSRIVVEVVEVVNEGANGIGIFV